MKSICGINCDECFFKESCRGCAPSSGCPFGKQCFVAAIINQHGADSYADFQKQLIREINDLGIADMPEVKNLNVLKGSFVNLEYKMASDQTVKLLDDNQIYLGNQLHKEGSERCYGIAADEDYILVCEYGCNGVDAEVVVYKRR